MKVLALITNETDVASNGFKPSIKAIVRKDNPVARQWEASSVDAFYVEEFKLDFLSSDIQETLADIENGNIIEAKDNSLTSTTGLTGTDILENIQIITRNASNYEQSPEAEKMILLLLTIEGAFRQGILDSLVLMLHPLINSMVDHEEYLDVIKDVEGSLRAQTDDEGGG